MKLFLTSFLQVFFVAVNTILLANGYVVGIFMASFAISYIWTGNVKKIAFSNQKERIIYAFGAGCGAVSGYYFVNLFI